MAKPRRGKVRALFYVFQHEKEAAPILTQPRRYGKADSDPPPPQCRITNPPGDEFRSPPQGGGSESAFP